MHNISYLFPVDDLILETGNSKHQTHYLTCSTRFTS